MNSKSEKKHYLELCKLTDCIFYSSPKLPIKILSLKKCPQPYACMYVLILLKNVHIFVLYD